MCNCSKVALSHGAMIVEHQGQEEITTTVTSTVAITSTTEAKASVKFCKHMRPLYVTSVDHAGRLCGETSASLVTRLALERSIRSAQHPKGSVGISLTFLGVEEEFMMFHEFHIIS